MHYDFDSAQQKLIECESVIDHDYFLTAIKADFLESARLFIFETYCRIHQVRPLQRRVQQDMHAARLSLVFPRTPSLTTLNHEKALPMLWRGCA